MQSFNWSQDDHSIDIKIAISGVSLKKIDVFISDLVVKVNVKENNFLKIFDLFDHVDFQNPENFVKYDLGVLDIYIKKQKAQKWDDLQAKSLSKEEVRKRREDSFARREASLKEAQVQRDKLQIEYEHHSTRQMMRVDEQQRNVIENIKKLDKDSAIQEIYSSINEKKEIIKKDREPDREENIPINKEAPTQKKDHDIFSNDEIAKLEEIDRTEEVVGVVEVKKPQEPKVFKEPRKATNVQLGFTERIHPNLAAREQHTKEPPLPKIGKAQGENSEDTQNPIWLKDKGDELFKNGDYMSAINAYSSAYGKNSDMLECLSNRACCFLNLFSIDDCIQDCESIIQKLDIKMETKYEKIRAKAVVRRAMCYSWKGELEKGLAGFEEIKNSDLLTPEEKQIVQEYTRLLQQRISLAELKKTGDQELFKSDFKSALETYDKILEQDPNFENVIANKGLIHLKLKNYSDVLEHCDKVLQIIKQFRTLQKVERIDSDYNEATQFLTKILLRKAKALEQLGKYNEALSIIEQILTLQYHHPEGKRLEEKVKALVTRQEDELIKQVASKFIQEKKPREALEKYNECLKKIHSSDTLTYLSVLLNKCTCHLFLEEYDEIISISIRGLTLITNQRHKVIAFTDAGEKKELNEKLKDFEIRFLVRRGNAYLKTSKFYHAKTDLEDAHRLDPKNVQIKKDLQVVIDSISAKS